MGNFIKRFANVGTTLHSYNKLHLAMMSFLIFQCSEFASVFMSETGASSHCFAMILVLG